MTRVPSKNVEQNLCDREDYVEDQEIKRKQEERELNQQEALEVERTKSRRERQVEKDEDGIVFDKDALVVKEQRLLSVLRTHGAKKFIAETASKLADKAGSNARKTWTDATRL